MDDKNLNTGMVRYGQGAGSDPTLPDISAEPEKKKSLGERIAGFLVSEDFDVLSKSIFERKIAPVLQRLAVDIFAEIVYRGKPHTNVGNIFVDGYTDYQSYSGSTRGSESQLFSRYQFKEIFFRSPEEAQSVLNVLHHMLRQKGSVTVADYFSIARQTPEPTYFSFGWNDLSEARVYGRNDAKFGRVYGIGFPKVKPIDS